MKTNRYAGVVLVSAVFLGTFGVFLTAAEPPETGRDWGAGLELLMNGNFDGALSERGPAGWFKAVSSAQTENLRAGIEEFPQRGNAAFIEQTGVKIRLANNWAQRVTTIPVGATVRVTADVKTQNVPANTGFVMVQCWNTAQRLIGGASSQSVEPIGETEDWRQVSFEFAVPAGTDTMILRCGLAESGKIWFDNVSMRTVSSAVVAADGEGDFRGRGFEVTEGSLSQLARVAALSDSLVAHTQRELGTGVGVRREVFARGAGQFQVVLSLDLSKSE